MKLQSTTQLTAQSLQQKAMNMLDKRIEKDLEELYSSGEIRGAVDLDGLVQKENEGFFRIRNRQRDRRRKRSVRLVLDCLIIEKKFPFGNFFFF